MGAGFSYQDQMVVKRNLSILIQGYAEEYQALAWILFVDDCATPQFIDSIVNKTIEFKIKSDQVAFIQQDLFSLKNQLPYQVMFRVLRWEERSPNMSLINKIHYNEV